jgi:hypothetical protein
MSDQEDKVKTLETLVNATRSKLDYQLNTDNAFDSKAGVMIAIEIGIATLYLQNIEILYKTYFIPLVLLGISIYLLWKVLKPQTYNTGVIDFYDDQKGYRLMKHEILLEQLLSDYQEAFDNNSETIECKNNKFKKSLLFFILSPLPLLFLI